MTPVQYSTQDRQNYQYVVFQVNEHQTPLQRDDLVEILHAENVLARYFFPGCHRSTPYHNRHVGNLPATERLSRQLLALPTGTRVGEPEIAVICEILRTVIQNGAKTLMRLRAVQTKSLSKVA